MFPKTSCVQPGKETVQVRVLGTGMCLNILTLQQKYFPEQQVKKLEFGHLFREDILVA